MEASIKLGKVWGIPIGLHASWFLIFGLITWSLATGLIPAEYPDLPEITVWLLAALTSLFFFGSVLAHELGHAFLALRNQIPVRAITLFIFGGVAQISKEPSNPGAEFRIAIAGPLVSFALAGLFGALYLLDQAIPLLAAPSIWLARINLTLAVFNLIPGFPLDGGRILRAIIWRATGSLSRATQIASFSGQVFAFGFIGLGVLSIFQGGFFNGIWLIFIGWFLQNAAAASYAQTNLQQSLSGVTVGEAMSQECQQVSPNTPISQLVEERILRGGQRCFLVAENGKPQGLITFKDITRLPQRKWPFTTVNQVMRPMDALLQVTPENDLMGALQLMDSENFAQIPVIQDDQIVGMLNREQVVHYIRTRAELGI